MFIMEFNQKRGFSKEPENKYGVHFEYDDLCERLSLVKKQREKGSSKKIAKSVDKEVKRNYSFGNKIRLKSKNCLKNNPNLKNLGKRNISSEFNKLSKIYSPINYKKISSPERLIGSLQFHTPVSMAKNIKQRITRSRMNTNQ